jgi:hypothetical protein
MPEPPIRTRAPHHSRFRHMVALALSAGLIAMLAALPTASANAAGPSVAALPSPEVQSVLGETPLSGLNAPELAGLLAELPAFEGVNPTTLTAALEKVLAELTAEEADLSELLSNGEAATKLETALKELLGGLFSQLEGQLGGNPATKLGEVLSSSTVTEILGKLLGSSPEPQALLSEILAALNPEALQKLTGGLPTGEPVSKQTVGELASELETTAPKLAEELGTTSSVLPETAMALTAPLTNGKALGAFRGAEGVTLGLIEKGAQTVDGGAGGNTGGTPAPGSTTIILQQPAPQTSAPSGAAAKAGKLKILSHHVKGKKATVVVEVPAAGKLTLSGKGVHSLSRETAKAERVTLHTTLSRAGAASARKHHHKLKVPLKVSFKPTAGAASSAAATLAFH